MPRFRLTVEEAAAKPPEQTADRLRFATMLQRGSLLVELYAPRGSAAQSPHAQDELHVVVSESGEFANGADRHPFGPGEVRFVPAGVEHRLENFTDDFQTWVTFYGPEGGERAEQSSR